MPAVYVYCVQSEDSQTMRRLVVICLALIIAIAGTVSLNGAAHAQTS